MEWIELIELTNEKVSYRYYPDGGEEYGIVSLNIKTGERSHDKTFDNFSLYARQAWQRLDEYRKSGNFPQKDMIAW